jgi:hypothetical protein
MRFGCTHCYGDDAEAAMAFLQNGRSPADRVIVDDSHFIVSLRHCVSCGQAFVSVFTEFVDWRGGDDAQYRDLVPVTADEAAAVLEQGEQVDLRFLGSLGEGRRRLSSDWPTGSDRRVGWRNGAFSVQEGH